MIWHWVYITFCILHVIVLTNYIEFIYFTQFIYFNVCLWKITNSLKESFQKMSKNQNTRLSSQKSVQSFDEQPKRLKKVTLETTEEETVTSEKTAITPVPIESSTKVTVQKSADESAASLAKTSDSSEPSNTSMIEAKVLC